MLNGKHILVVVPARGGSKGIPLKNLREINGIPMVGLVGKIVADIPMIDEAIVSTDHEQIAEVAEQFGLYVPFRRPDELSGDRISDIQVLTDALVKMEDIDNRQYEIIVMLQPTSPLRQAIDVIQTINKLEEQNYDAVWTISETDSKHHPLKQLIINDDEIDYYDKEGSNIIARQQLSKIYHRNGIAYAMTRDCLLNQKTLLGDKTGYLLINRKDVSIDTEADIDLVEYILSKQT